MSERDEIAQKPNLYRLCGGYSITVSEIRRIATALVGTTIELSEAKREAAVIGGNDDEVCVDLARANIFRCPCCSTWIAGP